MEKVVLPNGLTIIYEHKQSKAVVLEVMVKVGSNDEKKQERGVTHFIEHMLFEGTKKRPTNWQISNEIERVGGDFNAYTTNERTCFYIKVLKKHFSLAVDVLADMLQNPLFKEEHITKEKNIVIKEIDLMNDEPKYYQWILLQRTLFQKHPCRFPTYGEKKVLRALHKTAIQRYFKKYYLPNNMVIALVGDVPQWKQKIAEQFMFPKGKITSFQRPHEPVLLKNKIIKEKRAVTNTYMVLGFKTIELGHKDAYVLEVLNGVLGRGQSGKMFTEIRSKKGLAYDVGTQNVNEATYGFFAIYASVDKKNTDLVRNLMLKELQKIDQLTLAELKEAQDYIEGEYFLELEDAQKMADNILFWEQRHAAEEMNAYISRIRSVTLEDLKRVTKKYFKNHAQVIVGKI